MCTNGNQKFPYHRTTLSRADINTKLGETNLESYEIKNGMKAKWVNIHEAIAHNNKTMTFNNKKGMSIERETYLLKRIVKSLM